MRLHLRCDDTEELEHHHRIEWWSPPSTAKRGTLSLGQEAFALVSFHQRRSGGESRRYEAVGPALPSRFGLSKTPSRF